MYNPHSRRTTTRDIVKLYVERKAALRQWFQANKQRVSLTTDIWISQVTGASYMVITAHYIDKYWRLKKLIIGFKYVTDHKGKTIANTLLDCLAEWGIEKVFCVTVDNATANSNALGKFQSSFSLLRADSFMMNGCYMHMRCAGHIINLIVKDGLADVDKSVIAVRNAISYVRSGTNRRESFEQKVVGRMTRGSLPLDVKTRRNSTYLMLKQAIKFRGGFDRMESEDKLYNDHFLEIDNDNRKRIGPPSYNDWQSVQRMVKFLGIFYQSTLVVSASTTLNAHKCYGEIVNIASKLHLLCCSPDSEVKVKAEEMYLKFDKYWDGLKNINKMLIIATVFDPRKKMQFATLCLEGLYGQESSTAAVLGETLLLILRNMYNEYAERYNQANVQVQQAQTQTQAETSSQNQSQNTKETQDQSQDIDEEMLDGYNPVEQRYNTLLREIGVRDTNELEAYLREAVENPEVMMGIEFDILSWWKVNCGKYPILSEMARDLFAMQVSSVASESAFSTSGRIIEPYRSCLTHYMVEVLMCTEQWLKQDIKVESRVLTNAQILAEFEYEDDLQREFGALNLDP
ncbi:hypothetical protein AALP_AAs58843U000100 [Arabis alpina]|uniref:HAT C-terminal dimerisation domain-containing protein n=1 Tax=Arabis alpina TaxID=50452 RepID=A0A087FXY9_ARAAL|nr:hypothetical protein AALP_AAs58843U000100 [Arabis alpina]